MSLCISTYFVLPRETRWFISSVVDVPICASRIADKLGIKRDFIAVKDHILQSLKPGMTPEEVKKTLSQIGPVEAGRIFVDEEQEIHTQLLIRLCDNPLGNVLLLLYYSEDGHLINVVDPYDN